MPSTGSREPGRSVLPSFATPPILAAAVWTGVGPYAWTGASAAEQAVLGLVPALVVLAFTLADYMLWRRRNRPWHDWHVILLLLPAIAAGVWVAVGPLLLAAPYSRPELLGLSVGPGVALVGLLVTTISYHGRHHPDEFRVPPA